MMNLGGMRILAGYDGSPTFDIYRLEMKIDTRLPVSASLEIHLKMMMLLNDGLEGKF